VFKVVRDEIAAFEQEVNVVGRAAFVAAIQVASLGALQFNLGVTLPSSSAIADLICA
jgi:hypothetical protein